MWIYQRLVVQLWIQQVWQHLISIAAGKLLHVIHPMSAWDEEYRNVLSYLRSFHKTFFHFHFFEIMVANPNPNPKKF